MSFDGVVKIRSITRMSALKGNLLKFMFCFSSLCLSLALQDVTTELFGSENHGTLAAFGDLNSDKQTDIFIIRESTSIT